MYYCTIDNILSEISTEDLAKLSGDPTGKTINTVRVDWAIYNAGSLIDTYLNGKYDVPFDGVMDPFVIFMAKELAIINLYDYYYAKSSLPSAIYSRKLNILGILKNLQQGTIKIYSLSKLGLNLPPILSNNTDSKRVFDDTLLDNFMNT